MTEITSSADVVAGPGDIRYVKTTPAWGFAQGRMEVAAVGPAEGEPAIRVLALSDESGRQIERPAPNNPPTVTPRRA